MSIRNVHPWEIALGLIVPAAVAGLVAWRKLRKRPSPDELERARRQFLVQSGRIVDGTMLDAYELPTEDGRTLTMLLFQYRIGGVNYESSQDISELLNVVDVSQVRGGFPCSVRYHPGNPQSSIVAAEQWTGLRQTLPRLPVYANPEPIDLSHIPPRRG
jgi:hypothetical protein